MLHSAIEGFHVDDAFCDVEPEEDEAVKPSRGSRSLFLLRLGYKQGSIRSIIIGHFGFPSTMHSAIWGKRRTELSRESRQFVSSSLGLGS